VIILNVKNVNIFFCQGLNELAMERIEAASNQITNMDKNTKLQLLEVLKYGDGVNIDN
jgi:hypothetical protein